MMIFPDLHIPWDSHTVGMIRPFSRVKSWGFYVEMGFDPGVFGLDRMQVRILVRMPCS